MDSRGERAHAVELARTPPPGRAYASALALCSACALVPIWSVRWLPMVDLPQHMAQVSIWLHLDEPAWGFGDRFQLNWGSPYLLGYLLVRLAAPAVGLHAAFKLVLSAAVVALPLSVDRLLAAARGDRWWSLVGLPLAFGFWFHWGFFNFIVAAPLAILFVAASWRYAEAPTRRRGAALAAFAAVLYLCHVIALGLALGAAALLIAGRSPGIKQAALRLLPLAGPVPVAAWWLASARAHEAQYQHPTKWDLTFQRVLDLPSLLWGSPPDVLHPDLGAWALLAALGLAAALAGLRPRRDAVAWALPAAMAVLYLVLPQEAAGTAFLYQRAPLLLVPLALAACHGGAAGRRATAARWVLVGAVAAWLLVLTVRFRSFDAEARDFERVTSGVAPNSDVLGLVWTPRSAALRGGPYYLNFAAYCQAEKGGALTYSFAAAFPHMLAHYRPGAAPRLSPWLEWNPEVFRWAIDGQHDYFLVRSLEDRASFLFGKADVPVRLVARAGAWWLYQR